MGIAAGVILLGVIVWASVRSSGAKGEEVYLEKVEKRDIESIVSAPGEIKPKVEVNISAHVIGKIEKLYFEEGDTVKKGQRMVDLERTAYAAARDRMKSEVASRRIEVRRAEIALADSQRQFDRAVELRDQGIQAEQLYDQSKLALENAKANLEAAREAVRQATAALEQAEVDLSHTEIDAPMDGKVVRLNAREGEVVITGTMNNPGSVIAVLADLSEVLVEAEVGETEVVEVKIGQTAKVSVDAVADKQYTGKVVEIGSSATTTTGVGSGIRFFKVKVLLDDPDDRLRPGMTSQVEIVTDSVKDALSVPVQSVVERDPAKLDKPGTATSEAEVEKKKYVIVDQDGKAKFVEVETGISDATHVVIKSGLKGEEEVVTGPFRTLKRLADGDEITPRDESADTEAEDTSDSETSS